MYRPVLGCQSLLFEGILAESDGQSERAETAYRRAARTDPYAAEPWMRLAAFHLSQLQSSETRTGLSEFEQAVREVIARRGGAHTTFRRLGDWRLDLYAVWNDASQLHEAIDAYRRAIDLYPNNSLAHAQLAWCLHLAGETNEAVSSADRALQLDRRNPHRERQLAEQQVYDPTGRLGGVGNAEQLMHRLRR
jgi:tetratricopeptide (TPR) repeat protein